MRRLPKPRRPLPPWTPVLAGPLLAACDGAQSALQPDGPDARAIAALYWVLTAIAVLVCLAVVAALLLSLFGPRDFQGERPPLRLAPGLERPGREREPGGRNGAEPLEVMLRTGEQDRRSLRWIVLAGVAVPTVVLVGAYLFTLRTIGAVHPEEEPALTVEVIGRQWWWEVHYLDAAGRRLFETANEIHLPVGKRVRFRLRSGDVIHSFWVPRLGGKLDMIPGRTNQFSLRADEPGVYRGQCAEYCAGPHALMALLVVAQPEAEFARWAAEQARDAPPPADPLARAGREVFLGTACRACHTVRGTPASGELGPDLTHVASRLTLAAATIPNTTGHLGGWLQNPQEVKPAARMPAVPLDSEASMALLHYLRTLR